MVDTIFRLTDPGDTESSVGSTEKIEFNTGAIVPDTTASLITSTVRLATDINTHSNPDINLSPFQNSLLGPLEIVLSGYFIDRDATLGPDNLILWAKEGSENDNFENGRIGLSLTTMNGALSLVPTVGINGTGYEITDLVIESVSDLPKIVFSITLRQNGTLT